jgi:hypothetical protein
LGGIEEHESVVLMGDICEFCDGLDAPENIGGMAEDNESRGAGRECLVELIGLDGSGCGIEREILDGDVSGLLEEVQWTEDRVVFEFGGDCVIAVLQESGDDGVEAGGAARCEDDGVGLSRVGECGERGAGLQEERGRVDCGGVRATSGRAAAA